MTKTISDIFKRNRAALAPLAGVTDSVYRRICAEFGANPVMTEMISSEGFVRGKPGDKTWRLLRFKESERPLGFQFFGADPCIMAEAVRKAQDHKPDFIDINAGCPVKKVVFKGGGSALLRTPGVLQNIISEMCKATDIPVTVKIRSGWDHSSINAVEVARMCEDAGAEGIIVHPRTRSQGFSGAADWTVIRTVKEAISIPVMGSGDIHSPVDAERMLEETGADAVMIGRAVLGNPWLFSDVTAYFDGREIPEPPDTEEKLALAVHHLEVLAAEVSERFAVFNMRKFFGWYSRGLRGGAHFRREVFKAETIEEVKQVVRYFIEKEKTIRTENSSVHHTIIHSTMVEL